MGHPQSLLHLFSVFSNKQCEIYNKLMWKTSIQYPAPGFELTTLCYESARPRVQRFSNVIKHYAYIVWKYLSKMYKCCEFFAKVFCIFSVKGLCKRNLFPYYNISVVTEFFCPCLPFLQNTALWYRPRIIVQHVQDQRRYHLPLTPSHSRSSFALVDSKTVWTAQIFYLNHTT